MRITNCLQGDFTCSYNFKNKKEFELIDFHMKLIVQSTPHYAPDILENSVKRVNHIPSQDDQQH